VQPEIYLKRILSIFIRSLGLWSSSRTLETGTKDLLYAKNKLMKIRWWHSINTKRSNISKAAVALVSKQTWLRWGHCHCHWQMIRRKLSSFYRAGSGLNWTEWHWDFNGFLYALLAQPRIMTMRRDIIANRAVLTRWTVGEMELCTGIGDCGLRGGPKEDFSATVVDLLRSAVNRNQVG